MLLQLASYEFLPLVLFLGVVVVPYPRVFVTRIAAQFAVVFAVVPVNVRGLNIGQKYMQIIVQCNQCLNDRLNFITFIRIL